MLDVKVYKDSDLWIGALPVNERYFRGEKDKDVYGLLPAMGISEKNKKGRKGDDYFRVRPEEVSLPIILPTDNRQTAPDQAWLNVGEFDSGEWSGTKRSRLIHEADKRAGYAHDGRRQWYEKKRNLLAASALTQERGPEYLQWSHQALDFSAHTDRPTADFIERLGDGLMDGGDHEALLLRAQYAAFPGGSLIQVSDHEYFQKPALIAVVAKKRKVSLKERLVGRANILPDQVLAPNLEILERLRYIEQCRQHKVVQGHLEALEECFPDTFNLGLFTDRDHPALVRKLGSDFHFAYNLQVVGDVRKIPEVNGKKLEGFFNPTDLGKLLNEHKAPQLGTVWVTKGLEQKAFNGSTAWLDRAPKAKDPNESRKSSIKVA